jgi:DNA-binding transcriptional LysR family regulator
MQFTLRHLEVFVAIAARENVSAGAEAIAMSQSAASTALAELERRCGRPLFDRSAKRLRLNETGRMLLPRAIDLLDRASELDAVLGGRGGPGPLRLGATVTVGNHLAPALIERYRALGAEARIDLAIDNMNAIAARVLAHDLDLGLIEGDYQDPDLIVGDWLDDELAVFCAPGHRLAARGACTIDEALAEAWVVREQGSGTRQTLDRAMGPYWSRWRIGAEFNQIEAIKSAVAAGTMIGCVSRLALADAFAAGRLVPLEVTGLSLRRRLYTIVRRGRFETAGMTALLGLCRAMAEERAVCSASRAGKRGSGG